MNNPFPEIPSPCYVLEKERLVGNLECIRDIADASGVSIIPALKGFAMWRVFPLVADYVRGAAASSLSEVLLINREMGRRAHTYAPVYREEDFAAILEGSSHLTFNSEAQVKRFLPRLEEHNRTLRPGERVGWGVRINPGYSPVETALYNPASPVSRLGVQREELERIRGENMPEGLHLHALCESDAAATERLIAALEEGYGDLLSSVTWVNLGGGHLMTRVGYDRERLIAALAGFRRRHPHLTVYLEPGSAFAWETGFLKATVEDIVVRGGETTAMLDVSFTAHMPDCLEMPYQPRIRGLRIAGETHESLPRYRMGGNSCLAGDVIGDWYADEPLAVGDVLIFEDMIHYTMVKTTTFNGVHHPAIGILEGDGTFRTVREFGYQDYRSRLS